MPTQDQIEAGAHAVQRHVLAGTLDARMRCMCAQEPDGTLDMTHSFGLRNSEAAWEAWAQHVATEVLAAAELEPQGVRPNAGDSTHSAPPEA